MTTPGKNQPSRSNPNTGNEEEDTGAEEREGVRAPAEQGKMEELDDEEFERSLRDEDAESDEDEGDTIRR